MAACMRWRWRCRWSTCGSGRLLLAQQQQQQQLCRSHQRLQTRKVATQDQYSNERETHFGFQQVSEAQKAEKVHAVFENVASKYDAMNDVISFGIHRLWKDIFIQRLAPVAGAQLLDVAGGTGDIAFRYLDYMRLERQSTNGVAILNKNGFNRESVSQTNPDTRGDGHVIVCDITKGMLEVGKQRAENLGYSTAEISWVEGDAQQLPLADNSFDAYTIAFGIRNVVHIDRTLSEAYRVLRPGGRFMCLEFSHVPNPMLRWAYDNYSFRIIPILGQVLARDWNSYQYLVESIRKFPNQNKFQTMIEDAGFKLVTCEDLTFGVVAIHSGFKV